MRRSSWWMIPVAVVALLVAGGIGAALAGDHDSPRERTVQVVTATNPETGQPTQIVEVDNGGRWGHGPGWGFFPGFLLFPLIWIALIWMFVGAFWRGRGGRGGGWERWNDRMDEWHRRQHEGNGQGNPPGPASA